MLGVESDHMTALADSAGEAVHTTVHPAPEFALRLSAEVTALRC